MSLFVRRLATQILIDVLLWHYARVGRDPAVRHYFLTATFDTGVTVEQAPEVDVGAMIRKVRDMLAAQRLQAICVLEIDVLSRKLPGEQSRRLLFHIHGVCWTRDPNFKPKKVGRAQSARGCFRHWLGVPSITLVSRRESAGRHQRRDGKLDPRFAKLDRDQNARSKAAMAGYMLKHPLKAKHRYVDVEGGIHVYDDDGAFRLKTALRLAELWSHITPQQAVFAVGNEGRQLGKRFRDELRQRGRKGTGRKVVHLERGQLARAWARYFAEHPELGFSPSVLKQRDFR